MPRLAFGRYSDIGRNLYVFRCKHCGREWTCTGAPVGFVKASYQRHEHECGHLTEQERRKRDRRDIRRWTKEPPRAARITLDDPGEE